MIFVFFYYHFYDYCSLYTPALQSTADRLVKEA